MGDPSVKLPIDVTVNLYRIAQEALHNVVKHAGAKHVRVLIEVRKTAILLTVEDDGRGFDAAATSAAGVGLIGMRERALLIGGELQVESAPEHGSTIFARVPLQPSTDPAATAERPSG